VDIRFLSTFLEVSKTRHFGKAAENLYLTPAAVSARIKHLEESFNTLLFTRVRNGIQLTPAGESLVPYALSIENTLKQARLALAQEDVAFIACGLSANSSEVIHGELRDALTTRLPNASVKLEILSGEQLSRQLHERTIEVAFTHEPLKSSDIENILLRTEPLKLFSDTPHTQSVTPENYLHVEWCTEASLSFFSHYPQAKTAHFRTNSVSMALKQMRAKGGIVMLPERLATALDIALLEEQPEIVSPPVLKTYMVCMKEGRHPLLDELIHQLGLAFNE
jgi:DNA-binding transcriptional LysR family regulator